MVSRIPSADELERSLVEALGRGDGVIVDLTSTRLITARLLGILVRAHRESACADGAIALCGATPAERWLLERTGLTHVLSLYAGRDEALRAMAMKRGVVAA